MEIRQAIILSAIVVLFYAGVMFGLVPWIYERWQRAERKKYPNPKGDWVDP